mmetsp:Transcript_20948/g.62237  ORF Transcript_20948/g.62237 Transcript_20948/m.62237 type:complete len:410 (-) Transcript_20948:730-1959(-)
MNTGVPPGHHLARRPMLGAKPLSARTLRPALGLGAHNLLVDAPRGRPRLVEPLQMGAVRSKIDAQLRAQRAQLRVRIGARRQHHHPALAALARGAAGEVNKRVGATRHAEEEDEVQPGQVEATRFAARRHQQTATAHRAGRTTRRADRVGRVGSTGRAVGGRGGGGGGGVVGGAGSLAEGGALLLEVGGHAAVVLELGLGEPEELGAHVGAHRRLELVEGGDDKLAEERSVGAQLLDLHFGALRLVGEGARELAVEFVNLGGAVVNELLEPLRDGLERLRQHRIIGPRGGHRHRRRGALARLLCLRGGLGEGCARIIDCLLQRAHPPAGGHRSIGGEDNGGELRQEGHQLKGGGALDVVSRELVRQGVLGECDGLHGGGGRVALPVGEDDHLALHVQPRVARPPQLGRR